MKIQPGLAIALIVVGVIALAWGGFSQNEQAASDGGACCPRPEPLKDWENEGGSLGNL
ncbi:MAG: hypothetical protein ACXIUM_07615 [Wenzhouxiangella sp.]